MDPNVVLPSHHESQLPLAKQLDLSLTPPPVLFHVDDAEMASFAMPHVAERPASASSVVEMEMGLVPNIAPLDPAVTMAILDPSIPCPSVGISLHVSDIVQWYVEGKQVPVSNPVSIPGPSTSGVQCAWMITTPVKPAGWGKASAHSRVKVSKSSVAEPTASITPVSPAPVPALSSSQQPPAVSAAICAAQYFQQSKLWIQELDTSAIPAGIAGLDLSKLQEMYDTLEEQLRDLSAECQHANSGEKKQLCTI